MTGAVAVGVVAGLGAERLTVGRTRRRHDPDAAEPFGELAGQRCEVRTEDGIPLHVEESGEPSGPVTLVFVHGFANSLEGWHYQRRDLADLGRIVCYDHRSHGRSGRAPVPSCTLDQLGRDLYAVLQALVPDGPIVLIGHSMGGMTIMALAEQQPDLFGERVVGVALLSTSCGRMREVTFGLPAIVNSVSRRVVPILTRRSFGGANLAEAGRRVGTDLSWLLTRRFAFGSTQVSPALVDLVEGMNGATPIDVIAAFYPSLLEHDRAAALDALSSLAVLVLVGDADLICPVEHSKAIADALPHAEFVTVPGAGHMVALERAALVSHQLRTLVHRALPGDGNRAASVRADPKASTPPERSGGAGGGT